MFSAKLQKEFFNQKSFSFIITETVRTVVLEKKMDGCTSLFVHVFPLALALIFLWDFDEWNCKKTGKFNATWVWYVENWKVLLSKMLCCCFYYAQITYFIFPGVPEDQIKSDVQKNYTVFWGLGYKWEPNNVRIEFHIQCHVTHVHCVGMNRWNNITLILEQTKTNSNKHPSLKMNSWVFSLKFLYS